MTERETAAPERRSRGPVLVSLSRDLPFCAVDRSHAAAVGEDLHAVIHLRLFQSTSRELPPESRSQMHKLDLTSVEARDLHDPVVEAVDGFLLRKFMSYAEPVADMSEPGGQIRMPTRARVLEIPDGPMGELMEHAEESSERPLDEGDAERALHDLIVENPDLLLRMPRSVAVHFLKKHPMCRAAVCGRG